MSRVDRPALRGTLLGRLLRLWNPVMHRLLRSPLHWPWSRWFLVIEWTGRKSGRDYRTPVSYIRYQDEILITTGDRWWRNLVGGAAVRVWTGGWRREATAEPVMDEVESVSLHERMFRDRPSFAALAGMSRSAPTAELVRAVRAGRKLIRVRLKQPS